MKIHPSEVIGNKYHRLTVLNKIEHTGKITHKGSLYECKCDCGNTTKAYLKELRYGNRKSCGCLKREHLVNLAAIKRMKKLSATDPINDISTELLNYINRI